MSMRTKRSSESHASTGVAGLDHVLIGGFPRDHLYLVEGDPGTGKTTMALQFLLEGRERGESGLYVTLSESKNELVQIAASHGWNLDGVAIFEMTPTEAELSPEAQYTVFHPSDVELSDTTNSILKQVDEASPSRVVFDSLSELRLLARDALRYRRQILALKRYFSGRKCTVLMLDDRTSEAHDLQVQSIAHGVIVMERLDREFGVNRRRLEVRKLRGARYSEGFHDFTIDTGGIVLHPRLIAAEHTGSGRREPVPSGLQELDDLLGGGIDTGTSTLLIGPAGAGKSTVALQYAVTAANRGQTAMVLSFDETLATVLGRAASFGMPLQKHLDSGTMLVQQVDPAELSPGAFVTLIRDAVENRSVRLLIIDSLNGLLNAMPGERFFTLQLHELLSYLSQLGVATLMTVAQQGVMGVAMNSPVDITYIADTVILFRYFEAGGAIRHAISVQKKRSGMHERSIRELTFRSGKLQVGPALSEFEGVLTGLPRFVGRRKDLA